MRALPILGLLAGCGLGDSVSDVDRVTEPSRAEAEAAARPAAPEQVAVDPEGEAIPVEVRHYNLSELYQAFVSDERAMENLGRRLAGRVSPPAQVRVSYDDTTRMGRLLLVVPPDQLLVDIPHEGNRVDLSALAPLTVAMAKWRDELAQRFDIRIQSFEVGVAFFRGATVCNFDITGGNPPDGTVVSPCVQVRGEERCGTPEPEGVRFAPEVTQHILTCLDEQ